MTGHLIRAEGRDWAIYCISSGRPANVYATSDLWSHLPITWVVPQEQTSDYRAAGATRIIGVARTPGQHPLPAQRNAALDHAHRDGATCVQTDDDGKRLLKWVNGKAVPSGALEYLALWQEAFAANPNRAARLAGCAPLANAFYSKGTIKTQHWIMGQCFAVEPATPRFDPTLPVREDYDFTAQHLQAYGAVARHDALLPDYRHWANRGGCQDYRTPELNAHVNAVLLGRWPQYLQPNPRRPGELLFSGRSVHQSGRAA